MEMAHNFPNYLTKISHKLISNIHSFHTYIYILIVLVKSEENQNF